VGPASWPQGPWRGPGNRARGPGPWEGPKNGPWSGPFLGPTGPNMEDILGRGAPTPRGPEGGQWPWRANGPVPVEQAISGLFSRPEIGPVLRVVLGDEQLGCHVGEVVPWYDVLTLTSQQLVLVVPRAHESQLTKERAHHSISTSPPPHTRISIHVPSGGYFWPKVSFGRTGGAVDIWAKYPSLIVPPRSIPGKF